MEVAPWILIGEGMGGNSRLMKRLEMVDRSQGQDRTEDDHGHRHRHRHRHL